jgi:hypothetical protein
MLHLGKQSHTRPTRKEEKYGLAYSDRKNEVAYYDLVLPLIEGSFIAANAHSCLGCCDGM